jgi:putative transposase
MRSWPHSPSRLVVSPGTYMVTAGTYKKEKLFDSTATLTMLHDSLIDMALARAIRLEAWAVFPNHYHFVGRFDEAAQPIEAFCQALHSITAIALNKESAMPGRRVWFSYWQTKLTFERSFLARLNYVHNNPVKHGIVQDSRDYPFCSAKWFEEDADPAWVKVVQSFKHDQLKVPDDF